MTLTVCPPYPQGGQRTDWASVVQSCSASWSWFIKQISNSPVIQYSRKYISKLLWFQRSRIHQLVYLLWLILPSKSWWTGVANGGCLLIRVFWPNAKFQYQVPMANILANTCQKQKEKQSNMGIILEPSFGIAWVSRSSRSCSLGLFFLLLGKLSWSLLANQSRCLTCFLWLFLPFFHLESCVQVPCVSLCGESTYLLYRDFTTWTSKPKQWAENSWKLHRAPGWVLIPSGNGNTINPSILLYF